MQYKPVDFIHRGGENKALDLLNHCICCGFGYEQVRDMLKRKGYLITVKQFEAYEVVINQQLSLDIGTKQYYLGRNMRWLPCGEVSL